MVLIALFEKCLSEQFIASVEVSNRSRGSSNLDELKNINYIGCRARNNTINFILKSSHLSYILIEYISLEMK